MIIIYTLNFSFSTPTVFAFQQNMFEQLGNTDWLKYDQVTYESFKMNIAYAFYGPPDAQPTQLIETNSDLNWYGHEKKSFIENLFEKFLIVNSMYE